MKPPAPSAGVGANGEEFEEEFEIQGFTFAIIFPIGNISL